MKIPFFVYDFFAFLATGFVVLSTAGYAFDLGWLQKDKLPPEMIVFLMLAGYIVGHLVANVSSFLLEHKFLRGVLKSPEETLFKEKAEGSWARVFSIFYKPFPPETQRRILIRAKAAGIDQPGRGLFFHCLANRKAGQVDRRPVEHIPERLRLLPQRVDGLADRRRYPILRRALEGGLDDGHRAAHQQTPGPEPHSASSTGT